MLKYSTNSVKSVIFKKYAILHVIIYKIMVQILAKHANGCKTTKIALQS